MISIKKFLLGIINTFIASLVGYTIVSPILVFLLKNIYHSIYLAYAVLLFLPIFFVLALSFYFFSRNEKEIAVAIFLTGILSCLILGYGVMFGIGEMGLLQP